MYQRILIKLSGEALSGNSDGIIDRDALFSTAKVIKQIADLGVEVSIVVGAGNICRGAMAEKLGYDRVTGDKMGMLGTVINAFSIMDALNQLGKKAVVLSSVPMETFTETYDKNLASKYLNDKTIVVYGGGMGKPYFSTDTSAASKAIDTNCDAILMGKNGVEGIYNDDPRVNKNAVMFDEIKCSDIIKQNLKVMDLTAVELLKDKEIDVRVFNMAHPENFTKVVNGEHIGTTVKKG